MPYDELISTDNISVAVPTKTNENFRRARFLNGAAKSADFTAWADDGTGSPKDIYFVTTAAATIAATLPSAASTDAAAGRICTFIKVDSGAGSIRVTADSPQTVDGASFVTVSTQYDSVTVVSNGAEWFTI